MKLKHHNKVLSAVAVLLLASAGFSTAQAQSFYKWVDAKGSTHYTLTPPPKSAKKKLGKVMVTDNRGGSVTPAAPAAPTAQPGQQQPAQQNAQPQPQNAPQQAPAEQPR